MIPKILFNFFNICTYLSNVLTTGEKYFPIFFENFAGFDGLSIILRRHKQHEMQQHKTIFERVNKLIPGK